MTCTNPVGAHRVKKPNDNGKYPLVFNAGKDAQRDQALYVPCGKCLGCKADASMFWAIRCFHESTLHPVNSFLTLTYENAPDRLVKTDLQKFFKRLRHSFDFRYFACGEYGESTHRPHYHALIFGQNFRSDSFQINDSLYSSPSVSESWGHGLVSLGDVTMSSCCYVAGYVYKKVGDEDTFTLMSRRPGIGHNWLNLYKDDLRRTGSVTVEGREYPIPSRYLKWEDEFFMDVKEDRRLIFESLSHDELYQKQLMLPTREVNNRARLTLRSTKL